MSADLDPVAEFAPRLLAWHARHGRHDLPWQNTTDPYRVWLSEIMLQQTQVATVIPYYQRFLQRFPTLADLAAAPSEDVMALWSGLGYYARARNLHACAKAVVARHGGTFPRDAAMIAELPGIGRSTANSIAAFCFGSRTPILDGNVKRVLARCFGIEGFPGSTAVERQMWALAEAIAPAQADQTGTCNQAQMDLGSAVCSRGRPLCERCPLAEICVARATGRQAELPQPRPKKALPERETRFLILHDDMGVLLEQRPPAGIWGGLLSLPEVPEGHEAADHCRQLGFEVPRLVEDTALRHTFSHFRLTLRPLRGTVTATSALAEVGLRHWPWATLDAAPLPTPIRTLLAAAKEHSDD